MRRSHYSTSTWHPRQFSSAGLRPVVAERTEAGYQRAAQVATQDAENRAGRERQEQARRDGHHAEMEESFRRYGEVFHLGITDPMLPTRNEVSADPPTLVRSLEATL